jgi:hypothetical protein
MLTTGRKRKTHLKFHANVQLATNHHSKSHEQRSDVRVFLRALMTERPKSWKIRRSSVSLLCNANSVCCPKDGKRLSLASMRTGIEPKCSTRRVGAAFDTFLGFLRRGLTSEDLWVAVLVRHPTATQSELEIAAAASADVIRDEKGRPGVAAMRL